MSARPICQRCHRVKPVSGRYCATCDAELRANEQRRFTPDQAAAVIAAATARKAAATAPVEPPLRPGAQPRRPDLRVVPPAPAAAAPPPAARTPAQLAGLPQFVLPTIDDGEAEAG